VKGQMITGVWHGNINRQKAEIKIVLNGDALTGTSYYYESANKYRRYSIKGYFDPSTNSAVWWDDQLIEEKSGRFALTTPGRVPLLSRADFNCPGDGSMMLDGNVAKKENDTKIEGEVNLEKKGNTLFEDEWDYIIDNYTSGTNDPDIINSVAANSVSRLIITDKEVDLQKENESVTEEKISKPQKTATNISEFKKEQIQQPNPVVKTTSTPTRVSIEEKFVTREKKLIREIPLQGDSIELRFYDNAEIDGDSISLFLNDKLVFEHIRLTANAYIVKLAVADLNQSNDLIMVAENLGSIPPNTSYMLAIVDGKRYDAYLTSTEGSSAMIRFYKKEPGSN